MLTVFVEDLEFYGYHGVSEEEQKIGHRYVVSIRMEVDSRAEKTDKVADTVDYAAIAETALEIGAGGPFKTLERLAQAMGDALLQQFLRAQAVEIELAKLTPPFPAIAAAAGVTLMVERR